MAEPTPTTAMIPIVDHEPTAAVYVTAQRHRDDLVVATVRGEIDLSNISRLEKELAGHEEEPWLVIDLSDVGFCGVVGARLLHETAMRSSTAGRRFEVVDNPAIARLLKATGLGDGVVRRTSIGAESF